MKAYNLMNIMMLDQIGAPLGMPFPSSSHLLFLSKHPIIRNISPLNMDDAFLVAGGSGIYPILKVIHIRLSDILIPLATYFSPTCS